VTYCTPSVREIPVVTVEGRIDAKAVLALQRRLAIALGSGHAFVVVELSAITIERKHAIDLLCDALRRVDRHEGRLALAGAPPAVRRELERSVIDGVELYPTPGAAMAAASLSHQPRRAVRPRRFPPRRPTGRPCRRDRVSSARWRSVAN
jgi:anti-anti-sigma regulatory factor